MDISNNKRISIAVVDDHTLIREAISMMIDDFGDCQVILQAANGNEFIKLLDGLKREKLPDMVVLDINMKGMNGYETAEWLQTNYPDILILVLTVHDPEEMDLASVGVRGILRKDTSSVALHSSIKKIMSDAYVYPDDRILRFLGSANLRIPITKSVVLNAKEKLFLKLACTEMPYKEIAGIMKISERTVDNYRDALFAKLGVKSRVGIVNYAVKNGMIDIG